MSQLQLTPKSQVIYPDSDGKPMADNTKQFRWIVVIQQNLEWLFADNPTVFVAGDLLWYPVEGEPGICAAPDTLVVFGRPKGDRGSYKQWEEDGIPPQVVFEIRSPGNSQTELNKKQVFYNRYGVEEYYLYDPDNNDLSGWVRSGDNLDVIDPIANWISPRLQIRFDLSGEELQLFRPDNQPFLSYVEIARHLEQTEQQLEQERQRADQERQRADQAEQRAANLAERLRALGIDPEQI
ncbi:Uma2 family endonuclease [Oscillatoria sp. FACHB-1407]|uniref:Uma2 family endonuclease n=1 Tax=Oscillatoria sp. FACHB-1407 TaxID=2692847 RepID=UPI0016891BD4|nr:Uma2 family endonuclease [Oscillatoria sp. FACHB-1407]MBD2459846.1 Uma2 family endonuclease [Oscillatoria sp. FACHB-1407]